MYPFTLHRKPLHFALTRDPQHPAVVITSGTGTNDEPIMIDSDDDEGSAPAPTRRREPEEAEEDDGNFLDELEEDEYTEPSEEEEEQNATQTDKSIGLEEDRARAAQITEAVEGFPEERRVVDQDIKEVQESEEQRRHEVESVEEAAVEDVQPTMSSVRFEVEQPALELSLLPTLPPESPQPEPGPVLTDQATEEALQLYDDVASGKFIHCNSIYSLFRFY